MSTSTALVRSADGAVTGFQHTIPVATTDRLPGFKVVQSLGLVRGNSVRTRHVGKDILAVFKHLVGGEISEYTQMLAQSREQALDRMLEQAAALGADAVVGLRLTTSTVMQGAAEMLAYGTAVKIEAE
jgi:uncharacterized protein YbjQ (UPF0145 family)